MSTTTFQPGQVIGNGPRYQILRQLGAGGFGTVYLARSGDSDTSDITGGALFALKFLHEEHLSDADTVQRFRKEALTWVRLDRHPFIVRAFTVDTIEGRLAILMEYVEERSGQPASLEDHLARQTVTLPQAIRWSIQFCHGMEHAYEHGIRSHRDIKPFNVLLGPNDTIRISDFGFVRVDDSPRSSDTAASVGSTIPPNDAGATVAGIGLGTPTHMPPEQFVDAAACDERSDIYSFGIMLYQLASGGQLPFLVRPPAAGADFHARRAWVADMFSMHRDAPIPLTRTELDFIINRCLAKMPAQRYQRFEDVRRDLEHVLWDGWQPAVTPPSSLALTARDWNDKGTAFEGLGQVADARACYEAAVNTDPSLHLPHYNIANLLVKEGHLTEAVAYFDKSLSRDTDHAPTWNNKGHTLARLGRLGEALFCLEQATTIDPSIGISWMVKGEILDELGDPREAIRCYEQCLSIDPRNAGAWRHLGDLHSRMGIHEQAIVCLDKSIALNPRDVRAWLSKATALERAGKPREAKRIHEQIIAGSRAGTDVY